jgi:hypothetical protein
MKLRLKGPLFWVWAAHCEHTNALLTSTIQSPSSSTVTESLRRPHREHPSSLPVSRSTTQPMVPASMYANGGCSVWAPIPQLPAPPTWLESEQPRRRPLDQVLALCDDRFTTLTAPRLSGRGLCSAIRTAIVNIVRVFHGLSSFLGLRLPGCGRLRTRSYLFTPRIVNDRPLNPIGPFESCSHKLRTTHYRSRHRLSTHASPAGTASRA